MTNNLEWTEMKRPPLHHMKMWLASWRNTISFVIALDEQAEEDSEWHGYIASYRDMIENTKPVRIGQAYDSLEKAKQACFEIIDQQRQRGSWTHS